MTSAVTLYKLWFFVRIDTICLLAGMLDVVRGFRDADTCHAADISLLFRLF